MATKLYLRSNGAPSVPPSAGTKSAVLPNGTLGTNMDSHGEFQLLTAIGPARHSWGGYSAWSTAHYDDFIARYSTEPLTAQTIAADTWTIAIGLSQDNVAANSFLMISLYVYRPSTDAVVGYIYDAHTSLGSEWAATMTGQVVTFAGVQVVTASGDILCLETWRHTAGQDDAIARGNWTYVNDWADTTAGGTSNFGSYISTANSIMFVGGGASRTATIAIDAPVAQIQATAVTASGRVADIAMDALEARIQMSASVAVPAPGPVVSPPVNLGYAWTTQQLIDSVRANTEHTDCPLDHSDAPDSYHKEPLPRQQAADNALTPSGYVKTTLHIKDPAGIYYTTVIAEKT